MRYGFFNSNITGYDANGLPVFDRAEDGIFLAKNIHALVSDGIFATPANSFQVTAGEDMTVVVAPGQAIIQGYYAWDDSNRSLTVQASETLDRIDKVVLRLDLANRMIDLYVAKGVADSTPVAPSLNRPASGEGGDIYELGLANLFITKNTTSISSDRITDCRLDSEQCGIVASMIQVIDTSTYYNQINALVVQIQEILSSALDQTLAGNLQNQINTLFASGGYKTYTIATGSWSATTSTIDGTAYYTYSIALNAVSDDHPTVSIGASSGATLPTEAQQAAYDCLKNAYASSTAKTLTLYAEDLPESDFVIIVKGVS